MGRDRTKTVARMSSRQDRRASFPFYPNDWIGDTGLQLCSFAAQGLWLRLLCIMWQGEVRGVLTQNGRPLGPPDVARVTGGRLSEVKRLMAELEHNGVWSRDEAGAIYSRRMVREAQLSDTRAAVGLTGASQRWQIDGKPTANGMANACQTDGKCDGKCDGKLIANGMANACQTRWQSDSNVSRPRARSLPLPLSLPGTDPPPPSSSSLDAGGAADLQPNGGGGTLRGREEEAAEALRRVGVQDPQVNYRPLLEQESVTAQVIAAHWREIEARQAAGEELQNPVGLLLTRLKRGIPPDSVYLAKLEAEVAARNVSAKFHSDDRVRLGERTGTVHGAAVLWDDGSGATPLAQCAEVELIPGAEED